jgi:hypothetical protein
MFHKSNLFKGHASINGNWAKFMSRLGVNAVRLFAIQPKFPRPSDANYGRDLNSSLVTNQTDFNVAITDLRKTYGISLTANFQFSNPINWTTMFAEFNKVNAFLGSSQNTVKTLTTMGISTLLVEQIGCVKGPGTQFNFTTFDNTSRQYWSERWELYKFSYILAVWARSNLVRAIEFYNEPDLDLATCLNVSIYRDLYLIRSMSIQHAYADLNAQINGTYIEAEVAAAGFAMITFGGNLTKYLGEFTVQNRNVKISNSNLTFCDFWKFMSL